MTIRYIRHLRDILGQFDHNRSIECHNEYCQNFKHQQSYDEKEVEDKVNRVGTFELSIGNC